MKCDCNKAIKDQTLVEAFLTDYFGELYAFFGADTRHYVSRLFTTSNMDLLEHRRRELKLKNRCLIIQKTLFFKDDALTVSPRSVACRGMPLLLRFSFC